LNPTGIAGDEVRRLRAHEVVGNYGDLLVFAVRSAAAFPIQLAQPINVWLLQIVLSRPRLGLRRKRQFPQPPRPFPQPLPLPPNRASRCAAGRWNSPAAGTAEPIRCSLFTEISSICSPFRTGRMSITFRSKLFSFVAFFL